MMATSTTRPEQGRNQTDIANTIISLDGSSVGVRLGSIATVRDRVNPKAPYLTHQRQLAVEIIPQRARMTQRLQWRKLLTNGSQKLPNNCPQAPNSSFLMNVGSTLMIGLICC